MYNNYTYGTHYGMSLAKENKYTFYRDEIFVSVSSNKTNFLNLQLGAEDVSVMVCKFDSFNWTNGTKVTVFNEYGFDFYNNTSRGVALLNYNNPPQSNILLNPNNCITVSANINGNISTFNVHKNQQVIEFLYYDDRFYEIG